MSEKTTRCHRPHSLQGDRQIPVSGAAQEPARRPRPRFVAHLPDLMTYADYVAEDVPSGSKKVRLRISLTSEGVEILADSAYPALLDELLAQIGIEEVEKVLCG